MATSSTSIDFFKTEFFQSLRNDYTPLYKEAARRGESGVILVPYVQPPLAGAGATPTPDPPASLITQQLVETHILSAVPHLVGRYLNLRGERVSIKDGTVLYRRGSCPGVVGGRQARILAEESMFDQERSFRVLVIDGSLLESADGGAPPGRRGEEQRDGDPDVGRPKSAALGGRGGSSLAGKEDLYGGSSSVVDGFGETTQPQLLKKNFDYLLLFPDLEERFLDQVHSFKRSFVQVPGYDAETAERIDAIVCRYAKAIEGEMRKESFKEPRPDLLPVVVGGTGSAGDAGGDARNYTSHVDTAAPHTTTLILNPEYVRNPKLETNFDSIHHSLSNTVHVILFSYIFPHLARSRQRDETLLTEKLAAFDTLTRLLAAAAGGASKGASKYSSKVAKSLALDASGALERAGRELTALETAISPFEKLELLFNMVQHMSKALSNQGNQHLEADDLILVVIVVVWRARVRNLIAHTVHMDLWLRKSRKTPKEYAYGFSILQSSLMFFLEF